MSKQIAEEIVRQLGGNKFAVMTGAKQFVARDNGVQFQIGRNSKGVNRVVIKLNGNDLYDVDFLAIRRKRNTFEMVAKLKGKAMDIGAENLRSVFEAETGLYTYL